MKKMLILCCSIVLCLQVSARVNKTINSGKLQRVLDSKTDHFEKDCKVADLIEEAIVAGENITKEVEYAIEHAAPEERAEIIASALVILAVDCPKEAPQVIANIIRDEPVQIADEVMATCTLTLQETGLDPKKIKKCIEKTVKDAGKLAEVMDVASHPGDFVAADLVIEAAAIVHAEHMVPADGLGELPQTGFIPPHISNEIVGYGGQTAE